MTSPIQSVYPFPMPSTPQHQYQSVPSTPYIDHAPPAYTLPASQPTEVPTHTYYHEKLPTHAIVTFPTSADEKKPYPPTPAAEAVQSTEMPIPEPSPAFLSQQHTPIVSQQSQPTQQHQEQHQHQQQHQQDLQQPVSATSVRRNPQAMSSVIRNPQTFDGGMSVSLSSSISSNLPHGIELTPIRTASLDSRSDSGYSSAQTSFSSQPHSPYLHSSGSGSGSTPAVSTSPLRTRPSLAHTNASSTGAATASTESQHHQPSQHSFQSPAATQSPLSAQTHASKQYQPSTAHTPSTSQPHRVEAAARPQLPHSSSSSITSSNTGAASVATTLGTTRPPMGHADSQTEEDFLQERLRKQLERVEIIETLEAMSKKSIRNFTDSGDDTPRLFLIAPMMDEPIIKGLYRPTRILLPCQAPSAVDENEESVHMTSHSGYVIMNPSDFLHNNKDAVKLIGTLTAYFLRAASIAGKVHPLPGASAAGNIASAITHGPARKNLDNRTHMNHTGLDTDSLFEVHLATENHQREALKVLLQAASVSDRTQSMTGELRGIVLENGRTIWVCHECHDRMLRGQPIHDEYQVSLRDYESLITKDAQLDVTIRSSTSLIIFTNTLHSSNAHSISIRIASEYFETPERRSNASTVRSYQSLFLELGNALVKLRPTRLALQANSTDGTIYKDLQTAILKCPTLEQLTITGMPLFFQGLELHKDIHCRMLTKLVLDGLHVDTEDAANNLRALIASNTYITHLQISNGKFSTDALDLLFSDQARDMRRLFKKLVRLNLSDNGLDVVSATNFAAIALESTNLTHLDLSGNSRIGDAGGRAILTLLKDKNRKLVVFKTERTGMEARTQQEIQQCLVQSTGE
ncbi:hypothetical protein BGZ98_004382 [Dissophora globulifera]|nr:hypothetical protein BGZ98_004382 [Dissophora globulifera]